jgi:NAD(P)-dependent dehydrogenase (short-subunit alcohol dehydrogenase family)
MVVRHSQAKYGAYKMAKSALLAMSQSLATELGEQGIRVNSVAPATSGATR